MAPRNSLDAVVCNSSTHFIMATLTTVDHARTPELPQEAHGSGESPEPRNWWYYCDCCERKVLRHEDRYNCQECNDFDYCPECVVDAPLIHPGHTFAKLDAPGPPAGEDKNADASSETEAEERPEKPRCRSCAPVTQALPLLHFVLDPQKRNRMRIKWPLRISLLIEGTQRGCPFCCWMLHTFFRSSNCEYHAYTESIPWYARPSEHDKDRTELVEHCMRTLTRLKSDRFDFDVFPTCSRKGVKPWDFDKLTFQLAESNLARRTMEETRDAGVFHSAGVIRVERYLYAARGDPASEHLTSRPPNPSPASPEGIAQLKAWLHTCDTHHGLSCRPSTPTSPPSRLIDVSGGTTLRLVTPPSSASASLRYAALSYVWGGPQPFCTTTSTLHSRLSPSGFPFASLPPTLRDAVLTAQHLGIPYLWIDSLCIVQDDAEDKFRELARMGDIYKSAYLTIVAARASSVEEGFLEDRGQQGTGLWRALVPVEYPLPNEKATNLQQGSKMPRGERGRVYLLEESASMLGTLKDPVAERAWCLQERVLSPRVVSFGRWATWRCSRGVESDGGFYMEEGREGDPGDGGVRKLTQALVSGVERGGTDMLRKAQLLRTWRSLVEDYTRRKLTLQSDRLPAIAGIAREVGRLTGMEYLAGLWKENMLQDLMWYARTQEWRTRPEYTRCFPRAPTWSWASVEAPILCDAVTGDATPLARVLSCTVQGSEGKSTYDVVTGGTVEVRGPFAELRREDVAALLKRQDMAPAPPVSNDVQEWYKQMLEDMSTRPQARASADDVEEALPQRVFGLMLFERDWKNDRWDPGRPKEMETCYFGLLLSELGGGKFERIGAFWDDTSEFLDQTAQPWEEMTVVLV
ncbi:hypothetical protein VTI74DRAFT_4069 [Chaetomium olivicolor]